MQILLSKDVAIQITNIEKVKKLKEKKVWTKILKNKAKLIQKQCKIITFDIFTIKIDYKKIKKIIKKLVI